MKFYCKKQPAGKMLMIPSDWKIENLHYEKGFIPIEELNSYRIAHIEPATDFCKIQYTKLPYFISIVAYSLIESLTELCYETAKYTLGKQPNFWLLYYYSLDNICLLASEENYFSGLDHEIIEI